MDIKAVLNALVTADAAHFNIHFTWMPMISRTSESCRCHYTEYHQYSRLYTTLHTSLALVTNFSSWSCRDFNRPSRCSSWPRRQVKTTDKNGWLPSNDVLYRNNVGSIQHVNYDHTSTHGIKIIMLFHTNIENTFQKYQKLVWQLLMHMQSQPY